MKKILKASFLFILCLALTAGMMPLNTAKTVKAASTKVSAEDAADSFKLIHDMGHGINLGNTMESCGTWINKSVTSYETAWGSPVITKTAIDGYKKAGFKTVRVPVAWSNMMSEDGKYTINPDYMARVDEIVNWALDDGLYVVLNIHYDSGWWASFGSSKESERKAAIEKYKAVWTQLSDHYKDYPDKLILETANEELSAALNTPNEYVSDSGYYKSQDELYDLVNEINQTCVDIIRKSGGGNSDRYILVAGFGTDIAATSDGRFKMPEDTVKGRLIVSVHFYSYLEFSSKDSKEDRKTAINSMKNILGIAKRSFCDKGYPVIIGEYNVNVMQYSDTKYRLELYKALIKYACKNGMCPLIWDTATSEMYDRTKGTYLRAKERKALKKLSKKVSKFKPYKPSEGGGDHTWKGDLGLSGWVVSEPVPTGNTGFGIIKTGNVYQISGVEWSALSGKTLTISATDVEGASSVTLGLGRNLNVENQYWPVLDDPEISRSITLSAKTVIDLSGLNLSDSDNIYISFSGAEAFSGKFTLIFE